jgi:hypothetical protein
MFGEPGWVAILDAGALAGDDSGDSRHHIQPGPQQIWMQSGNNDWTANWQQMGTYTTSTVNNANPSTGPEGAPGGAWTGSGGSFTYQASSPNGWSYLTDFTAEFNFPGQDLGNDAVACRVDYSRLGGSVVGQFDFSLASTRATMS